MIKHKQSNSAATFAMLQSNVGWKSKVLPGKFTAEVEIPEASNPSRSFADGEVQELVVPENEKSGSE